MNTPILKTGAALLVLSIGAAVVSGQEAPAPAAAPASIPVAITVDAAKPIGAWKPVYRFFGADEPNYATMKDGRKLLDELGQLRPGQVYFRAHNLLTSGDGTPAYKWGSTDAYTEDAQGNPVYNWRILDYIFDAYRAADIRPYVQIGFMPEALSINPEPYRHEWRPGLPYGAIYTGWSYPPKSYEKWGELCYQWAKHCVERYGMEEVEKWYWEVWNESNNTGVGYWNGGAENYRKLYDYAAAGVLRAIPKARIGGADSAGDGNNWSRDFIQHCISGTNYATGQTGAPLDFFSFHAKGTTPAIVDGHVRMGIGGQLSTINRGFAIAASYPQTKDKPIIIGESDPDGCAACIGPNLAYRPLPLYASYTAACIPREFELADRHGVNFEGALTWAFEFEDQPFFFGQRVLATNGIDLPILNLFRMYSKMDGQRLAVTSDHAYSLDDIIRAPNQGGGIRGPQPDVSAMATLAPGKLCIVAWHYHDDYVQGPDADVSLTVSGLPANLKEAKLTHYRIDNTHSNPINTWVAIGAPPQPNAREYAQIKAAGQLQTLENEPATVAVSNGQASLKTTLPRQSVSMMILEWPQP